MSAFTDCARETFGDVVDSWDEVVIQPLIEAGRWFRGLDTTLQYVVGGVLAAAGSSAIALLAAAVGMTAATVVLPIIVAFAGGVGIGTGLIVLAECGDRI